MNKLILGLTALLFAIPVSAQQVQPPGTTALVCAYNASPPTITSGKFAYVQCDSSGKIISSGGLASLGLGAGAWNITPVALGTGYVPGDSITPSITGAVTSSFAGGNYNGAVFYVATTQVVSATVAAGGTACSGATASLTGTTGNGGATFYFTATAPISGGAIQNPVTITAGGSYSVNPTSLAAEPVTGSSCSGSQLNVVMGVNNVQVQNPGSYSTIINNAPATQSATSGTGTGATFTVQFGAQAAYLLPQPNSNLGSSASTVNKATLNFGSGYLALNSVTTGVELTAYGWGALTSVTTGGYNTAFGVQALGGVTTQSQNAAFGRDAGRYAGGLDNTMVGDAAGTGVISTSTYAGATGVGSQALTALTSGAGATAVGYHAGTKITSGGGNTLVGYNAGAAIVTGQNITAVGASALVLATGNNNTAFGSNALATVLNGTSNTAIGELAGNKVTGSRNTLLGVGAGSVTLTTGTDNVLIGTSASIDTPASGTSNTIQIGAGGTAMWAASATGTPATGTSTFHGSTLTFPDIPNAAGNEILCFSTSSSAVSWEPSVATCVPSGMQFKIPKGIIDPVKALAGIMLTTPAVYEYKPETGLDKGEMYGLYADQVCEIDERLCFRDAQGKPKNYDHTGALAIAFAAIKEQQKQIDELKQQLRRH